MPDDNRMPGRPRAFMTREAPRSSTPVPHVELGRLWRLRHSARQGQTHIVTERDGVWFALCSGAKAIRSYRGRPDQAGCVACRAAGAA